MPLECYTSEHSDGKSQCEICYDTRLNPYMQCNSNEGFYIFSRCTLLWVVFISDHFNCFLEVWHENIEIKTTFTLCQTKVNRKNVICNFNYRWLIALTVLKLDVCFILLFKKTIWLSLTSNNILHVSSEVRCYKRSVYLQSSTELPNVNERWPDLTSYY